MPTGNYFVTSLKSDLGTAQIEVPKHTHRSGIRVTVQRGDGTIGVIVNDRATAFKLVGMLLGESCAVVTSDDAVPTR